MKTNYDAAMADINTKLKALRLDTVEYELDHEMSVAALAQYKRIQVRDSSHNAPKATVRQYALQMQTDKFPPVVVTKNGYVIDGNTRIAARVKRKDSHMPAVILDIDYDEKNVRDAAALETFAGLANQTSGQRLSDSEAIYIASRGIKELGWNVEKAAAHLGMTVNAVGRLMNTQAATEKFAKLGLDTKSVNLSTLVALGKQGATVLNDRPYQMVVALAGDAGFTPAEVADLSKRVREAGSDDAAISLLQAERTALNTRIVQMSYTSKHKPSPTGGLRQRMGYIGGFDKNPTQLVETDPTKMAEHEIGLEKSIAVLSKALAAQKAARAKLAPAVKVAPAPVTTEAEDDEAA